MPFNKPLSGVNQPECTPLPTARNPAHTPCIPRVPRTLASGPWLSEGGAGRGLDPEVRCREGSSIPRAGMGSRGKTRKHLLLGRSLFLLLFYF